MHAPKLLERNRVVVTLVVLALLVICFSNFASVQANRIVPGQGLSLLAGLGWPWLLAVVAGLLGLGGLALWPTAKRYWLMLGLSGALLIQLPVALAWFIQQHISAEQPYARVGLAGSCWSLLFIGVLLLVELQQRIAGGRRGVKIIIALLFGVIWLLISSGALAPLALLREYSSRSSTFWQLLYGHLSLVGGALLVSLVIGLLVAWLIIRVQRLQRPVFALLNFFQTIPSLALFGLLIAPLSYLSAHSPLLQQLDVRGIGWAPALLALIAYSLLPVVRNTCVALQGVAAEVIESARGMGMSSWQVFSQVRLPLALPVIIEGIRITTIQAIGLTAVAALIGASGFGSFIFQGLGQGAMDLVLLGALPTIILALLADALFSSLASLAKAGAQR
ncbi:ABC transporter permease [Pseudomonas sp. M30-35]|uniref:ABC transporter permease n=1 Tax=Pseudomonas sp. M30-35 TaxID=1981174 RepID=UPI000B3CC908|nr:ABC transporter permease [Pseudomonas sp. M30-35]ARU89918.1 ABC transporter permease [Pseudomonas sp. M30-35]